MENDRTITGQLTGILSESAETDAEVVLSVRTMDGSHRQYHLQGKERIVTEPEKTQSKPTVEDLTAEIELLKKMFLTVYQTRIDGMVKDTKYGPRMAEQFRDACSEGFLHALHCLQVDPVNLQAGRRVLRREESKIVILPTQGLLLKDGVLAPRLNSPLHGVDVPTPQLFQDVIVHKISPPNAS